MLIIFDKSNMKVNFVDNKGTRVKKKRLIKRK